MAQNKVITPPTQTRETLKILVEGVSLSIADILINFSKLRASEGGFAGGLKVSRTPFAAPPPP